MQVIAQGLAADGRILGCKGFAGRAVPAVDGIHVINQVHHRLLGQVLGQPAAEFGSKVVFAVRKSPGAAEPAHDRAGNTAQAVVGFAGSQRAVALRHRVPFFQHNYGKSGKLFTEFPAGKNCGRPSADYSNIIFFPHTTAPHSSGNADAMRPHFPLSDYIILQLRRYRHGFSASFSTSSIWVTGTK